MENQYNVRICFVGDSFVNGTGDPDCLGWTGRICASVCRQGYDITYYNLGIRRETSADIANRWLEEVSRRLPDEYDGRIVFSFGVNDTTIEQGKLRIQLEESVKNAYHILTAAQQLFPVLMVSPPPIADNKQNYRIAKLSEQLALVCHQLDVPYLDVFTPLQASAIWMDEVAANDGAHPSSAGYSKLAELVQDWDAWLAWFHN
ncbi:MULTISPECIES: GDSL-type esterase/lipase family protein [unclassified Coleofasciculus]|uniref:GDSL-type esterase/lipase family protein n=1 Tax=unclassified Coleofasciculus TaxID=2692782 RepID=UPI00187F343D|nr:MULTISPECIES: GDSL-type esterase/lipase family protein [unclassified Coleofasciculus]MBE9125172.1 lipase [Coleofasciculus sp. LEGE 07081]MBE9148749.1 lipase [Coleofasciculus sp. LEGE 07092]